MKSMSKGQRMEKHRNVEHELIHSFSAIRWFQFWLTKTINTSVTIAPSLATRKFMYQIILKVKDKNKDLRLKDTIIITTSTTTAKSRT